MGNQELEPWMLALMKDYSEGLSWQEAVCTHNVQNKLYKPEAFGTNAIGKIIIPEKCSVCGGRQVGCFASRGEFSLESPWGKNTYCISCGHKPSSNNCKCKHCRELKQERIKDEEQKRLHAQELKREKIRKNVESYNERRRAIEDAADIPPLTTLLALLEQSADEDPLVITPLDDHPERQLAPSIRMSVHLLQEAVPFLQFIEPCPSSARLENDKLHQWEAFAESYKIISDCEDPKQYLLSRLKDIAEDRLSAGTLARHIGDLILEEALEFLRETRESYGLQHQVGDKTVLLFKRLIVERSLGEIFYMIYRASTDCAALIPKERMSNAHVSNLIIGNIERLHFKARDNCWQLRGYKRFEFRKQNWLSYVYFNLLLQLPGDGLDYTLFDVIKKLKLDQSDDCLYSLAKEYPHAFDAIRGIGPPSSNEEDIKTTCLNTVI